MQEDSSVTEPNLKTEAYRNHCDAKPSRRVEKHLDFIEISEDGWLFLGTSNLTGRIWSGSVWAFSDSKLAPDLDKYAAGTEFESGVCDGKILDNNSKIIIAGDTGSLHLLSLTEITDKKSFFFTTIGITSEHDDCVLSLDVLNKKTKIVSGSSDMSIKIWDSDSLVCEKSFSPAHGHLVTSVSSMQEGNDIFVSTSLDGNCLLWDIRLDKPASLLGSTQAGYTASSWIDDKCVSLGAASGSVSLIDTRTKSELFRDNCAKRPIHRMKFHKKHSWLAVCADDPVVRVFSSNSNSLITLYESENHVDFVRGLAWDPTSDILYTSGWDRKVYRHEMPSSDSMDVAGQANQQSD